MIYIVGQTFTCGVLLEDNHVTMTAPVVGFMKGWTREQVLQHCNLRGWTAEEK